MWLSKQTKRESVRNASGYGIASIGGQSAAVVTDSEHREVTMCSIGGVFWLPRAGEELVILSPDSDGRCILGCVQTAPEDMEAGELVILTDAAAVRIKNNGAVEITGDVSISGSLTVNGRRVEGEDDGAEA